MDTALMMTHLNEHMTYPATKDQLVAACNHMSEFTDDDKKWFADKLPAGSYNSAEDVKKALGV